MDPDFRPDEPLSEAAQVATLKAIHALIRGMTENAGRPLDIGKHNSINAEGRFLIDGQPYEIHLRFEAVPLSRVDDPDLHPPERPDDAGVYR
jgi:hypothetical protein